MKTLVALCCLVAAASAVSFIDLVYEEWNTFKLEHKKTYSSELEERFRMKIFADNKHRIALHNQRYEQGLVSFKLGQNKYGDMLHHEFINTLNGFNKTIKYNGLTTLDAMNDGSGSNGSVVTDGGAQRVGGRQVADNTRTVSSGMFSRIKQFIQMTTAFFGAQMGPQQTTIVILPKRLMYNAVRGATYIPAAHTEAPHTVDWRKEGAVTPVKDQGKCGSCWSFSTTGALEGQHFRKTGVLVSLSEQNLIDCSTAYGNNGCNGGLMDNAFKYIKDNGGIDTEKTYPYEAMDDKCRYNAKNSGADDVGFTDIPEGDEEKLKLAIATVGPVSVAIDASQESFQLYSEGVYYDENCSNTTLDHGVLAVGYGTDETDGDYWLIKNSWGPSWGEEGYIKIARNKDNHCGVATAASYPIV